MFLRMPRGREIEESLSVSRKSLKQGKLELLVGLCFLEVGTYARMGPLSKGDPSTRTFPKARDVQASIPFFKILALIISVLLYFLCIFYGIFIQVFLLGVLWL